VSQVAGISFSFGSYTRKQRRVNAYNNYTYQPYEASEGYGGIRVTYSGFVQWLREEPVGALLALLR